MPYQSHQPIHYATFERQACFKISLEPQISAWIIMTITASPNELSVHLHAWLGDIQFC